MASPELAEAAGLKLKVPPVENDGVTTCEPKVIDWLPGLMVTLRLTCAAAL